jgi:hypothetical protein
MKNEAYWLFKDVGSSFTMLLIPMTDFAKIALVTDHVRPSQKLVIWIIRRFNMVGKSRSLFGRITVGFRGCFAFSAS